MNKEKYVFQLKITLNNSDPKIWRRIIVPSDYSFFDLHCAIQDAMGWTDSHLHGFYISQKGTARPIIIQFPEPENDSYFDDKEVFDETKENISEYFGKKIKQCQYTYDFGDNWDHTISLEKQLLQNKNAEYPICMAGENACPPEDCGGVGGYDRLIRILKNSDDKEYNEMCEWLGIEDGIEFDPTEFNTNDVYFNDPKTRLQEWRKGFMN